MLDFCFLADDALLQRIAVRNQLQERGLKVKELSSSEELITALEHEQPDFIALDSSLAKVKDSNGLTSIDLIKQDPTLESIPFIILHEKEEKLNKQYYLDLDIDIFLEKPADEKQIDVELKRVNHLIREAAKKHRKETNSIENHDDIHELVEEIANSVATVVSKKQAQTTTEVIFQERLKEEVRVITKEIVDIELKKLTDQILKNYVRRNRIPENWARKINESIKGSHKRAINEVNQSLWKKLLTFNGLFLLLFLSIHLGLQFI